ncbi:MAG: hydrolase 1, exosortase A system-associated [Rhodocyclaceae bacterium]|nr:hydrolase 1, exosortase A system-associated [Rhodocyclaceae bacterium]
MSFSEHALTFDCAGETLVGILARPAADAAATGVVIVVGGPQTRVGSHRQFVLLARALAAAGYPALRFDVRGMGDSGGAQRDFEAIAPDIGAAIDAFQQASSGVTKIVLWGLCDAASASLLYIEETRDPRIAGLCLLNPWVRSEASLAKTQVKHYYGQRLLQAEFWRKLLSGRLNIVKSIAEFAGKLAGASSGTGASPRLTFQDRMAAGWRAFPGPILLILSGDDYTAKEFLEYASSNAAWHGLLDRPGLSRLDMPTADHTFSSQEWRKTVENACLDWLEKHD